MFAEPRAPMFFAVWKHAPIKTTLLRELEEVCDVTYREFEDPEELRSDLDRFFCRVARAAVYGDLANGLVKSANETSARGSSRIAAVCRVTAFPGDPRGAIASDVLNWGRMEQP